MAEIQVFSSWVPLTEELAAEVESLRGLSWYDRTPEQWEAFRTARRAKSAQKLIEANRFYDRIREVLDDNLARVLDLHRPQMDDGYEYGPQCWGCELAGYEAEYPCWPCATTTLIASLT